MPLEQAVHDHDCCDDDDPMMPTRSGGSGGSGGSGSGSCIAPYFSGGLYGVTNPAVIVLDADATTSSTFSYNTAALFCSYCTHGTSYDYTWSSSSPATPIATVSITSAGTLSVKPNGNPGVGQIIVQPENCAGKGDTFKIDVYSFRLEGYEIFERAWGEGVLDSGWHPVEDKGNDWSLLWRENEYLWKPVFSSEAVPPPDWARQVNVSSSGTDIAVGNNSASVYGSGGSCGVGGIKTYDQGLTTKWPCAYGTPTTTGVLPIDMAVRISPTTGTVLNSEVMVTMKPSGPSTK